MTNSTVEKDTCGDCAWGRPIERNITFADGMGGTKIKIRCMESPTIVERDPSEYCSRHAHTRESPSDGQDQSRVPAERAARYKCLCMDACTIMKNILGNTSIPFKEQRARIAQWENDLQGAITNDVDSIK